MKPAAPVTSVRDFPVVMVVPQWAYLSSCSSTGFHERRFPVDRAIEGQRRQRLLGRPDLNAAMPAVGKDVQRPPGMIPTAVRLEQSPQGVRRLPMRGQQRRSGGIAPAEHEREM